MFYFHVSIWTVESTQRQRRFFFAERSLVLPPCFWWHSRKKLRKQCFNFMPQSERLNPHSAKEVIFCKTVPSFASLFLVKQVSVNTGRIVFLGKLSITRNCENSVLFSYLNLNGWIHTTPKKVIFCRAVPSFAPLFLVTQVSVNTGRIVFLGKLSITRNCENSVLFSYLNLNGWIHTAPKKLFFAKRSLVLPLCSWWSSILSIRAVEQQGGLLIWVSWSLSISAGNAWFQTTRKLCKTQEKMSGFVLLFPACLNLIPRYCSCLLYSLKQRSSWHAGQAWLHGAVNDINPKYCENEVTVKFDDVSDCWMIGDQFEMSPCSLRAMLLDTFFRWPMAFACFSRPFTRWRRMKRPRCNYVVLRWTLGR